VSHENYRSIRSEDDRRAYNREKQRESRARRRASNQAVNDSQAKSALSAQSEAEAEADTEADPEGEAPSAPATPKLRQAALKKAPKAKGWKIVPESWQPNDKHRETAAEEGKDFDRELAKFRDHEFKDPKTDANRAFANWLRREDYGKANGSTRPLNKSEVSQRNAMAVVGKYEREEKALAQKQ
jgi:hypothetical protein